MTIIEMKKVLRKHGAEYIGIQKGYRAIENMVLFNIKGLDTTGALAIAVFTEDNIKRLIRDRKRSFTIKKGGGI